MLGIEYNFLPIFPPRATIFNQASGFFNKNFRSFPEPTQDKSKFIIWSIKSVQCKQLTVTFSCNILSDLYVWVLFPTSVAVGYSGVWKGCEWRSGGFFQPNSSHWHWMCRLGAWLADDLHTGDLDSAPPSLGPCLYPHLYLLPPSI